MVRARIAAALLRDQTARRRVGAFSLRPAQIRATKQITDACAAFGGALLADPPGTGKTVIALAVATELSARAAGVTDVLVVAPATLRAQWLRAAAKASRNITFVSMEALSRGLQPSPPSLLIVDEAQHLRTPSTKRYAALARVAASTPTLLLSATPVVNSHRDRDALLALFLGARATQLSAEERARVIIRRDELALLPALRALPSLPIAAQPAGLAEAIASLPPPLPARDGAQAAALIASSLAMAWCSSLAALDAALRRRLQRGGALADALRDGRWPDRRTLNEWLLGEDATQLAMPLLLMPAEEVVPQDAARLLEQHLEAVRALRHRIAAAVATDTRSRAVAIAQLLTADPQRRIVAFAQQAVTVRALYAALRTLGGVVAITGDRVLAASGRWSREEVLRAFGRDGSPPRGDDPRAIHLLLTTDLLAEGVELQGAGLVLHLDPAWTPARLEQRVGRAARLGGRHEVSVTAFALPDGADALLQLARRLRRKRRARERAVADAESDAALHETLASWRRPSPSPRVVVAAAVSPRRGFLALLRIAGRLHLVGAVQQHGRWDLHTNPAELLAMCLAAGGASTALWPERLREARQLLARWWRRRNAGLAVGVGGGEAPVVRSLRRRLDAVLRRTPIAERARRGAELSEILSALRAMPGIGIWREVPRLMREQRNDRALIDALRAFLASAGRRTPAGATDRLVAPRLVALLILEPTAQRESRSAGRAARSRSARSLA